MSKTITRQRFKERINAADIAGLFNDLGWDHANDTLTVQAGKAAHALQTVANKRGFAVLVHTAPEVADKGLRQSIEKKVARIHFEHLIVFRNTKGDQQVWQLAIRRPNQPITFHETQWHKGQEPELLYQKLSGLFIPLDEEGSITLVDVRERVTREFEKQTKNVTKKFYSGFKKEHDNFLKFIEGLNDQDAKKWYASLMLNRLMFIYFLQAKGFMNEDRNYLRSKLEETQKNEGKDKFYGFYRNFLRVLFHQGLGDPKRTPELEKRIGKVPYLNGGLFDEHDLEKDNPKIQIKDEAFKALFDFFDKWNWMLDTSEHASGDEVNPDVIGYIFEQYINERAKMGAYYTKEDITEYIAKNTIIPWLFDAAKAKDAQAFKAEGGVWELLRNDPDRYIHESVKKGVDTELMEKDDPASPWYKSPIFDDLDKELRAGLNPDQKDLVAKRKCWNRPADTDKALPTEIWRETIERRRRYLEVRRKLMAGEVTAINDLITYNLDIRQFAQDVLHEHESGDLVWAFYDAIQHVTVLDPTCGSGAFLFAALGILQPLYEECLQRMAEFRKQAKDEGKPKRWQQFQPILDRIEKHHASNRAYFIYKSIILQNLYGVDIMPEAVEIAKLRLFLKLVSTVEPQPNHPNGSYGIEPLPDIDFNIRAGNTLVGFATRQDVKDITKQTFDFDEDEREKIEEESEAVDMVYERWKGSQLEYGPGGAGDTHVLKKKLQKRTAALNNKLDGYLAKWYQITDVKKQAKQYETWRQSHRPFHWFTQFYGIINVRGGFDVIIGNPPYVDYSESSSEYNVKNYATLRCGNLYAYVTERARIVSSDRSYLGLIVPMSITSIREFSTLRSYIAKHFGETWTTNHAIRPQSLFTGVAQRVSIQLAHPSGKRATSHSTRYLRSKDQLRHMFENLDYTPTDDVVSIDGITPKLGTSIERSVWKKLMSVNKRLVHFMPRPTKHDMYVKDYGESYWIFPFSFKPYLTLVKSYKQVYFSSAEERDLMFVSGNSSLFYWYYTAISDCWHFGTWHLSNFPLQSGAHESLIGLALQLKKDLIANRITRYDKRIGGDLYEYKVNKSKPILDEIDTLLAGHYGLSAEELDFIINYDIKYRMGSELEGEE
jgi:hypothetical protein